MGKGQEIRGHWQIMDFSRNVFINCPFDEEYLNLLRPLIFTVLNLGYNPRIASERFDSGEQRIEKICKLINESKFSIHDLSRMRSIRKNELFRLNMPFELGIDVGCRRFKKGATENKVFLILEKEKYKYQEAISDLSGVDIKEHNDEPEKLIRQVRDWFVINEKIACPSATKIWEDFNEFMADFYRKREREHFKDEDLQKMPTLEFVNFIREWLRVREKS